MYVDGAAQSVERGAGRAVPHDERRASEEVVRAGRGTAIRVDILQRRDEIREVSRQLRLV